MKNLTWITVSGLVVLLILAFVFIPKPAPAAFAYDKLPILGSPDAPVKVVEFGDYKCPSCQFFSQQIEPQIKKDFVDKGGVSFYFMNFTFIGPDSYTAALAAQSIYHQNNDAYWKFYDALYKNQQNEKLQWATPEFLVNLAKQQNLPIDFNKLQQDIVSRTYAAEVDEHNAMAKKLNVTGTPTLFINGEKMEEAMDYAKVKAAIEKAQKGAK
ncbi:DsbA family protein [Paenibacillus thalictri]|uniref:DsbA family protein n=2 Tax=Paenibacillus thalictri TaxID=2527873 RepID=A0A4Q9DQM5_9BACL|nr:DsbA family protein [Paenibacillus thalictri]